MEFKFVRSSCELVWCRLAQVVGGDCTASELMASVYHACHVAMAYIDKRVLSMFRQYPWVLVLGDVNENLRILAASNPPDLDAGCGAKVKKLLDIGRSAAALALDVNL